MQSLYLLGRNSSDCRGGGGGGCGLFSVPSASRRLASFVGMWAHTYTTRGRRRKPSDRTSAVAAAAAGGEQDHYAVLGIVRTATAADIKRAYRLLARQYHPDVSRDLRAGEIFKKIHLAYEVLSDNVARAQYDISLNSPIPRANSWNTWSSYSESDEVLYRWAKQRHQTHYKRQDKYGQNTWYYKPNSQQETSSYERGSFSEVLRFTFFTLLFMQFIGHRASLALCGAAAMLDNQLDVGYKMGYAVALLFGGRRGVFLALCIYFTSWLCGKKNSSLVALVVLAMWAGAHIARFAPIPQGAVLTLLYMSIKLHVDSK